MHGQEPKIAATKTAKDWNALRVILQADPSKGDWQKAINGFLIERLRTRYLRPIEAIEKCGDSLGEGFAVTAIICAMIEFLAALRVGGTYKHGHGEFNDLYPWSYGRSKDLFVKFLTDTKPFEVHFTQDGAKAFYANIRCGLLHEAATKEGWRIRTTGPLIDCEDKTVNRTELKKTLDCYLDKYSAELLTDKRLQAAFIRKFDWLAEG